MRKGITLALKAKPCQVGLEFTHKPRKNRPRVAGILRRRVDLEATMSNFVWKLAVSVAIIALIVGRVDVGAVGQAIGQADGSYLSLALCLSIFMVLTDALLWRSALRSLGHNI